MGNQPRLGEKGFSLVGAMASVFVLGVVAAGTAALFAAIGTQQKSVSQKLDASALAANLIMALSNQNICTSQLANPANTVGNSVAIDVSSPSMATGSPSPTTIQYLALAYGTVGSATIARVGQALPGSTSGLIVQEIALQNIVWTGAGNEYVGTLRIDWTPGSQTQPLKPVTLTQLFTVSGPLNAANITQCGTQAATSVGYFVASEQHPSGTAGTPIVVNGWTRHTINTAGANTIGATIDPGGTFSLPAGRYYISASAHGAGIGDHLAKLRNVTTGTDIILGTMAYAQSAAPSLYQQEASSNSLVQGYFELTAPATLEITHIGNQPGRLGRPASFGVNEVFALVSVRKF